MAADRERLLREQLETHPEDVAALRELAELVGTDRTRKVEAAEIWRRHAAAADDTDALLSLAKAQVEARQENEAIATLRILLEGEPDSFESLSLLGELLRRAGDLSEAVEAFTRAAELDPSEVGPRVALMMLYEALGDEAGGREQLNLLRRLGIDDPAVRGLVRELLGRRET